MKIKVCGLKYDNNIQLVSQLDIDFLGFIFYEKSPRYIEELPSFFHRIDKKKVGVFVNEKLERIKKYQLIYNFDFIQLHGNEHVRYVEELEKSVKVIKAFQVDDTMDFGFISEFKDVVSYFLFDTKSKKYGGSGQKFNWKILEKYILNKPFFLSGGINEKDAETIKKLNFEYLYGVDINSAFEDKVGVKNIQKIKDFTTELKS